ncbi:MAG: FAD-dependent oxidoreductase [Oscillospiraceae bacterium]|nr:FAD-dependent oxidoreductase [Oscillospiraceae bacterium]
MFNNYDIIIVGAGISGLYTALNLDKRLKTLLISKKDFTVSNTALAQGGIAAEFEDLDSHIEDTLKAGKYENNRSHLQIMVERAAENIDELIRHGVDFDRLSDGTLSKGLEGGHSRNRIVHHKDSTGYEIVTSLSDKVKRLSHIDFRENSCLLRLARKGNYFFADIVGNNSREYYCAPICIMATGGIGGVYNHTTNSSISTGDGIHFAHILGARIEKMNLIQFHPTAFAARDVDTKNVDNRVLLITEAARGEGAFLLNADMKRFTDELAPRDIVSQSIVEEGRRLNDNNFYLDLSHRDSDFIKLRFPMIYEQILKKGYDLTKEPVPISPCQHYLMGGITVDSNGKTTVAGLYAVGECAYTGVHGANRLASNSLLEALVFSRAAADDINGNYQHSPSPPHFCFSKSGTKTIDSDIRYEIRDIMQRAFFVTPNREAAKKGLKRIEELKIALSNDELELADTPEITEIRSMATVAELILRNIK